MGRGGSPHLWEKACRIEGDVQKVVAAFKVSRLGAVQAAFHLKRQDLIFMHHTNFVSSDHQPADQVLQIG